jgi:hypothetical protein
MVFIIIIIIKIFLLKIIIIIIENFIICVFFNPKESEFFEVINQFYNLFFGFPLEFFLLKSLKFKRKLIDFYYDYFTRPWMLYSKVSQKLLDEKKKNHYC